MRRLVWIYRAPTDLLISLCWVPLFMVGHQLAEATGTQADERVRWAVAATLLISFLHQPLTFALVYGDRRQFRLRRRLYLWAPPITVAVIALAVALHLWVIVPIAAMWNTIHTLQQRYGLSRIYARRARYGSAFLDRWVLYASMTAAVLVVAARRGTLGLAERVSLAGVNGAGVRLLSDARPVASLLLIPVGGAALVLIAAVVRQEVSAGTQANPAKWIYQGSSLLLIASIAVDPIAGFIAYVGAHAIEYAVVVYKTAESRYRRPCDGSNLLGKVAWSAGGRVAVMSVAAFGALALASLFRGDAANVVLFTVGALHFLYDGFIWKLRKPAVAADFAITAAS
ncbi:MAG: hypothetical protein M3083_17035 [Actinomycetota bacterium]|nr:hypothetical protein [Actinomycetota bacterium]